jgi:hypothetical protein
VSGSAGVSSTGSAGVGSAGVSSTGSAGSVAPITPAATPVNTPAVDPAPGASAPPATLTAPPGTLELESSRVGGGPVVVRDAAGVSMATLDLRPGNNVALTLPPGTYSVEDSAQGGRITLSVEPGKASRFEQRPDGARGSVGEGPRPLPALVGPQPQPPPEPVPARPRWKRVAAPLLSAGLPGLGQMVNRQPGKGVGFLLGALALGVGAAVMMGTSGGTDVSSKGLGSNSFGTEAMGAVGYGLLSGGLQMLYAAQIMEAYATAAGTRGPRPRVKHRVSIDLTRMATIGLRPGDPAAGFFPDWSLSVLGQVARRFSVGVGDLSLKQGRGFERTSLQGGLRLAYRFLERDRVWLGAAAGVILQGSFSRAAPIQVPEDAPTPGSEGTFAAVPYAQLDLRFFILDRWSLNLIPRVSAPLAGPRFFNGPGDRVVPKNAATLELGTGVGVYF